MSSRPLKDYRQVGAQPLAAGAGWLPANPGLTEYESGRVRFAPAGAAVETALPAIDASQASWKRRTPRFRLEDCTSKKNVQE